MEGNIHHTHLRNSCNPMILYLKALSTTVHLSNRLLSPSLGNESPFNRLFGHPTDYSTLCIFGCVRCVHLPPQECTKLSAQSVKCIFLGYSPDQKGFLCYIPTFFEFGSLEMLSSKKIFFFATQYDFLHSIIYVMPLCSNSSVEPSSYTSLDLQKTKCCHLNSAPKISWDPSR
ncbi:hypothetical protein CR513_38782, partial [Mucuna pruriens]